MQLLYLSNLMSSSNLIKILYFLNSLEINTSFEVLYILFRDLSQYITLLVDLDILNTHMYILFHQKLHFNLKYYFFLKKALITVNSSQPRDCPQKLDFQLILGKKMTEDSVISLPGLQSQLVAEPRSQDSQFCAFSSSQHC